jgi:2-polyprenyl-3-methyl-5-hydroxy-6-metoxy-1,4-benzoquinol methylase
MQKNLISPPQTFDTKLPTQKPLRFKILNEIFYKKLRTELNKNRFLFLKNTVRNFKNSVVLGIYNSDKDFLDALDFFLKSTSETRHRGWFFLKHIVPLISQGSKLLEIGPGNGIITKWICRKFDHVTIVDTNHEVIKNFNVTSKILKKNTTLKKTHKSVLFTEFEQNYYDLSVISHVFYYIDYSRWIEATMRVYNATKPGGIIVIVINGDQYGKLNLIKKFNGRTIPINSFIEDCFKTFVHAKIELFKSIEEAKTIDIESMLQIAGFFLYDVGTTAKKTDLIAYINNAIKQPDKSYRIDFPQKFIVIHKNQ